MQTQQLDDAIHAWHHNFSITDLLPSLSRVAQWKRAGPITQRSEDQNLALLDSFFDFSFSLLFWNKRTINDTTTFCETTSNSPLN